MEAVPLIWGDIGERRAPVGSSGVGPQVDHANLQAVMAVLDMGVHVGALLGAIATVRALKSGRLATLVLEVTPQGVPLLVHLAAVLADVAEIGCGRRSPVLLKLVMLRVPMLAPRHDCKQNEREKGRLR
jgi:hypothetical protein